jgi:hypothetical protein
MAFGTYIGKASGEDAVGLGTQAWNIADGFTKIKILRLIIQLDIDEEIAMFGRKDDQEQTLSMDYPYKRVESFEKFVFHLKQLIGNCKFSIEKGLDENIISQLSSRIQQVEEVSDGIADWKFNDVTKESDLRINEEHFKRCFDILREIKDELNFPINRAGLIFRQGNELDLDAVMRGIEENE